MIKKAVTHPGIFHADDVFAAAILRLKIGGLDGMCLTIERRNPTQEDLDDPEIVVFDVGGQFDPAKNNYDHHQRDFDLERDPTEGYGIEGEENPFASAGLLWTQFPLEIGLPSGYTNSDKALFHEKVDAMIIRGIDAKDCGKAQYIKGQGASISSAIHWLNPTGSATDQVRDEAFNNAVDMATDILLGVMANAKAFIDGKKVVLAADAENGILVLPEYVPWVEHIFSRPDIDELLYVVFPSERGGYMLQQIPVEPNSFEGRKPLPEAWAGLRGEALADATGGLIDVIFVHPNRFCGGAESLETTLKMAELAINS
jgi:uncharacterized UPF0160 family protein